MDEFNWADLDALQFFSDPSLCHDADLSGCPSLSSMVGDYSSSEVYTSSRHKPRMRASRACIQCRSRHLKCDSSEPTCNRCLCDGKACVYMRSRRGGRHKAKTSKLRLTENLPLSALNASTPGIAIEYSSGSPSSNLATCLDASRQCGPSSQNDNQINIDLLTLYYDFFNGAHPFTLPRRQLEARLDSDSASLQHVLTVIRYIGSMYDPNIQSEQYQSITDTVLQSSALPANPFSVQALVLYAIARHCTDDYDIADQYIDTAIDIALSLGMNRKEFALVNGDGDRRLEESWRRTWWALYMADTLFAAISHRTTHRLQTVDINVDLPCEDSQYESGV